MTESKPPAKFVSGDLILRNHPLAYVVETSRRSEICAYCFCSDASTKRCAKCKLTSYCTPECQKKAWKEGHKLECEGMLRTEGKLSSFMQMLAQTVLRLKMGIDGEDPARNQTPFQRKFYDLASHWSEAKQDQEIAIYIEKASSTLAFYFSDPSFSEILQFDSLGEIYSRIKSNAYAIQGPTNEPLGHGVFLSAAKFDHSCRPNAAQSYDGPDMLVHAITDIPTLEDVRVTYTALNQPARLRRKFLKEHYFFDCECERCNDPIHDAFLQSIICSKNTCGEAVPFMAQRPGPYKCPDCGTKIPGQIIASAESLMSSAESAIRLMEDRMGKGDFRGAVQLADPIFRRAAGLLHPKNFVISSMSLTCSSVYTSLGDANMAFTFSQNALEGTTFAYPAKHIAIGSHLLQLIKLGLMLRASDSALWDDLEMLAASALDIAAVSAGEGTTVYRKAQTLQGLVMQGSKLVVRRPRVAHHHDCGGCGGHDH
ncbi:putative Histone-lysine N-methyltransferase SMYD3 [Hypsibius exemplaris]|uniref:Histone-lysine N-methyltransferase SMYD3 n=1 Tax=Hypsibius exemplaris TaxID=2072580 RepID=A0A1W0WK99_HYPEX|nr:putative Histone-lysine N-methyltransferase SMYD3 [Hypsibius exemplaris]